MLLPVNQIELSSTQFFFIFILLFLCMVLSTCVSVPKEGTGSLQTRVIDSCKLPCEQVLGPGNQTSELQGRTASALHG